MARAALIPVAVCILQGCVPPGFDPLFYLRLDFREGANATQRVVRVRSLHDVGGTAIGGVRVEVAGWNEKGFKFMEMIASSGPDGSVVFGPFFGPLRGPALSFLCTKSGFAPVEGWWYPMETGGGQRRTVLVIMKRIEEAEPPR